MRALTAVPLPPGSSGRQAHTPPVVAYSFTTTITAEMITQMMITICMAIQKRGIRSL